MIASKIDLKDDNYCIACGKDNGIGLKLEFTLKTNEEIECEFVPLKMHQGFAGIVHGGIIALVLDEAMVNLLWKSGEKAVTSEFQMRLLKTAHVGKKLFFKARIDRKSKRVFYMSSICKNARNEIVAKATAKCMKV